MVQKENSEHLLSETQQLQRKIQELNLQIQTIQLQHQRQFEDMKDNHERNLLMLKNQYEQMNQEHMDEADKQKLSLV